MEHYRVLAWDNNKKMITLVSSFLWCEDLEKIYEDNLGRFPYLALISCRSRFLGLEIVKVFRKCVYCGKVVKND